MNLSMRPHTNHRTLSQCGRDAPYLGETTQTELNEKRNISVQQEQMTPRDRPDWRPSMQKIMKSKVKITLMTFDSNETRTIPMIGE
jgi:hypothetical protein